MPVSTISAISGACDSVLALIYPQACAVCGSSVESRHDGIACSACWEGTQLFGESDVLCRKCGAFAEARVAEDSRQAIRCGQCDLNDFTAARACGLYRGALRASVLALKREPQVSARLLKSLVDAQSLHPINQAEVIIPVPLHPKRERERGHNQAAVLARELSRVTNLLLEEHSLARRIHTEKHRAGMDACARRESVAGAFEVWQPQLIAGRRVLLVDDVFTTGATVSECAAVLKLAGASAVYVMTIARA